MEKLIIIDETVKVYSSPNLKDTNVRNVKSDDKFYIKQIGKKNDILWIKVTIDESFDGYINEINKVAVILHVKLNQEEVTIYEQPTTESKQITVVKKGTVFKLFQENHRIQNKKNDWDNVELYNGKIGFMNSTTKVSPINIAKEERKKKCEIAAFFVLLLIMIIGLIFLKSEVIDHFNFIIKHYVNPGIRILQTVILSFFILISLGYIFYFIFYFVTGLFKSKEEKYYYQTLIDLNMENQFEE